MNTNNKARALRKQLVPKQYTASPWQWAYVAGVHPRFTTALYAAAAAGTNTIETLEAIPVNSYIVVGGGGQVIVTSCTGSAAPFTVTVGPRTVPLAAESGAPIYVIATCDLYLDGWQNAPDNLPPGVAPVLTTGVRHLATYTPVVGHVVLVGRGTGLQRSDRFVHGNLA